MKIIDSKNNVFFKDIKKLKERKYRKREKAYIIEGFRFVSEAILCNANIRHIIISNASKEKAMEKIQNLRDYDVYVMNDMLFKQLCSTENPQGIIAIINIKEFEENIIGDFFILADKVQDPGNMGTIIRTAHAAGASGVILTKGTVDVFNDKTLRSTMGSIFHVPIIEDDDSKILSVLKKEGFKVVASSLKAKNNFFEENLLGKIIIAVGNEGNGISKEIEDGAEVLVKIPMPGNAESLNVSIAAAIMIYEKVRQNIVQSIE